MALLHLSPTARVRLQEVACRGANARQVRRAQALLWLAQGNAVQEVAQRLGVSRQSIYAWVMHYQARRTEPILERVAARPHPGRAPEKREAVVGALQQLLRCSPSQFGERAPVWTTPLLWRQVERLLGRSVSRRTVRRGLHQLRYRYKRPRYSLARQSPTWRHAKGGSNAA